MHWSCTALLWAFKIIIRLPMPLTLLYWHKSGIVCKLFPLNCKTGDVENGSRLSSGMFPMKLNCKSRLRRESLVDVMFGNTVRELFDMANILSLLAWISASVGILMILLLSKLIYLMLYVLHVRSGQALRSFLFRFNFESWGRFTKLVPVFWMRLLCSIRVLMVDGNVSGSVMMWLSCRCNSDRFG